jgi:hypothetical protein
VFKKIRSLPSPALVISVVALVVAVGGGTLAVAESTTKRETRIAKKVVRKLASTLSVLHAKTADNATNARNADRARLTETAKNALKLDGQSSSNYRVKCPTGLRTAAELCFEADLRPALSYANALSKCGRAQRRLPDDGELALVFDHLGAPQDLQWSSGGPGNAFKEDSSRQIAVLIAGGPLPFRCVTSLTNVR